jgi:hypothetical protein
VVLAAWSAVWFLILAPGGGIAWKFFVQGTDLLFTGHDGASVHPGGLHLYASYPQLQIGPAAYAVAEVLRQIGPDKGMVAAEIAMAGLGMLVLVLTVQIALAVRPDLARRPAQVRWYLLVAGAFFVVAWQEMAVAFGHLDDTLAITCTVAAVWVWVTRRLLSPPIRAALAGTLIGLAAAAKPWAFVFLPVICLPSIHMNGDQGRPGVRDRAIALGAVAVVTVAGWVPFFAADPATVHAMHYQIANMPNSALRALGIDTARTPSWDRATQIVLGCALGLAAIVRRRWAAVILLGAGARIALDPGVHKYYTPEVMVGALLWELVGMRRPLPVWTVTAFATLNLDQLVISDPAVQGAIRLAVVLAFTVAVLLAPARGHRHADPVPDGELADRVLAGGGRSPAAGRGAGG